jgi:hypothetical protein
MNPITRFAKGFSVVNGKAFVTAGIAVNSLMKTNRLQIVRIRPSTPADLTMTALRLFFLLCLAAACPRYVQAQSWTGGDIGNSQNWSDANNWSGNVAPSSGSVVVFPGPGEQYRPIEHCHRQSHVQ